ncbi:unnamed protein product, partial [marine sediment metagenome]
ENLSDMRLLNLLGNKMRHPEDTISKKGGMKDG